ncbi:PREDICTED: serine/threonine-protein kinase Nek3, partial [Propithecus coquereli]|uniref:serine/threonine-protein kinase Nek3 n=1 Tax=Propithecus coquereli TaxID=379532 RepID=UPI00063F8D20
SDTQNSRKEAVLLAKMKHPNIVAFKESFEAEGHLYIVMEYCDGGDLMQKIKQQKGKLFPEDMNIFLTQNGKVKLGDFGSAHLLSNPMAFACTYVGTPYYVPPEIWENLPYNNKSDIWSLGCILYELCTLRHPFQANSWKNLILKICQGSISPLPSHYSYELQCLVQQMFKRNPSHRPSATTLLSGRSVAQRVQKCLPPECCEISGRLWPGCSSVTMRNNLELLSCTAGSEDFLKGPLSEETEASDSVDGGQDSVILDPERLKPGLEEEDTDFEEDDSPDWVSELKKQAGLQGVSDG